MNRDERLEALRDQMTKKPGLETGLNQLQTQQKEQEKIVRECRYACMDEQSEVERLESRAWKNFFYRMSGQHAKRLESKRDALADATEKYETAKQDLEAVEEQIRENQHALNRAIDAEEAYRRLLTEKADALSTGVGSVSENIRTLRREIAGLDAQIQECTEAVRAGQTALHLISELLDHLKWAENWSRVDLVDGSVFSDAEKYSALREAERQMQALGVQLKRFNKELQDVFVRANMEIQTDGWIQFADVFLDDLFSGIAMLNRVKNVQISVREIEKKIQGILNTLNQKQNEMHHARIQKKYQLDMIVLQTKEDQ